MDSVGQEQEAVTGTTVTVNKQLTTRHGEYFHGQISVSNTNDVYEELIIVGVLNNVNTNGEDAVASSIRHRFLPADPEISSYDSDGNLISDGRWTNTWNGENRLIKMETRSDLVSSVPDLTMEFEYDSQGRRFKRTVTSNSVSTITYFLYDGWNLIAELDSSLSPIRTYTWGSDLSGSMQGAGGVGGLLAIQDSSDVYYASYDGNGNVTALIDSSDGSIAAVYEYDPFGQILRMTGDYAEESPFRFSTKYQDESGWVYYGYRYLIPGLGRWASRDPIGEEGFAAFSLSLADDRRKRGPSIWEMSGAHVSFLNNDAINIADYLGLTQTEDGLNAILRQYPGSGVFREQESQFSCFGHALGLEQEPDLEGTWHAVEIVRESPNCSEVPSGPCRNGEWEVFFFELRDKNDNFFADIHLVKGRAGSGPSVYSARIGGLGIVTGISDPYLHTVAVYDHWHESQAPGAGYNIQLHGRFCCCLNCGEDDAQ